MMSHRPFAETTLRTWEAIHQHAHAGWIYRGQGKARWSLKTSIERCFKRQGIEIDRATEVEDDLVREFRRAYHQYSHHMPAETDIIEWLSLMQHYGAPTRLLDFTYSIYVASYFALETADEDAAVWAVNGAWALDESANLLAAAGRPDGDIQKFRGRFVEGSEAIVRGLLFTPPIVPLACPMNPFRLNERLRVQKGVFLMPGSIDIPFEENLAALPGYDDSDKVLKIIIPKPFAGDALAHLFQMNISRASLFPGLDGYAQALGVFHPSFKRGGMFWYASKKKGNSRGRVSN